ncbi:MAG: hypothetical protein NC222_07005 [Staphylococcus sp.]|nr:hypothetical protein [Staphylococcus sp.]
MMKGRGMMTDKIQKLGEKINGFDQKHLRLMAYIDYLSKNEQKVDPSSINAEERKILQSWKKQGFGEFGINTFWMTKEFYMLMQEILWEGYCGFEEEE